MWAKETSKPTPTIHHTHIHITNVIPKINVLTLPIVIALSWNWRPKMYQTHNSRNKVTKQMINIYRDVGYRNPQSGIRAQRTEKKKIKLIYRERKWPLCHESCLTCLLNGHPSCKATQGKQWQRQAERAERHLQRTLRRRKTGALIVKADKETGLLKYVDFHHSLKKNLIVICHLS